MLVKEEQLRWDPAVTVKKEGEGESDLFGSFVESGSTIFELVVVEEILEQFAVTEKALDSDDNLNLIAFVVGTFD